MMSSECLTRRRRGRRRELGFVYRVRFGYPRENHQDMRAFTLDFTRKRFDDAYRVTAYKLVHWDGVER